jgi:hypothetical protein
VAISGTSIGLRRNANHRSSRRRDHGDFRVVPHLNQNGDKVYLVVAPTGVQMYTFEDIHAATTEAAELNSGTIVSRSR